MIGDITLAEAWGYLLAAAGALVALSKAMDIILARLRPSRDMRARVDGIERKLISDKERLDEQEKANAVIFRALYAQINHEISGNGDEILRRSRDEIQDYLTNR